MIFQFQTLVLVEGLLLFQTVFIILKAIFRRFNNFRFIKGFSFQFLAFSSIASVWKFFISISFIVFFVYRLILLSFSSLSPSLLFTLKFLTVQLQLLVLLLLFEMLAAIVWVAEVLASGSVSGSHRDQIFVQSLGLMQPLPVLVKTADT